MNDKDEKARKGNMANRATIAPATATLVVTKEAEPNIDLSLLPCARCGRRGPVGDTPIEGFSSDGKAIVMCFRFERATGELICKQCLNEVRHSDDSAENDALLEKLRASRETHLSIDGDKGRSVPVKAHESLARSTPNIIEETNGMDSRQAADGFAESACTYASSIFKRGKQQLLSGVPLSGTAYFFTVGKVVILSGTPFEDMQDERDHLRFSLPLFALALAVQRKMGSSEG